jgi:hypothetical protein
VTGETCPDRAFNQGFLGSIPRRLTNPFANYRGFRASTVYLADGRLGFRDQHAARRRDQRGERAGAVLATALTDNRTRPESPRASLTIPLVRGLLPQPPRLPGPYGNGCAAAMIGPP